MALAFVPAYYALQPNDTNNNEVNTKQEKTQRTQDLVRLFKHIKGVPGVVVVVMKDGKIQFEQGFGYADVENGLK
jgi:CubicO group peptidase (beta-lactamase class C family)